jgi:alkanesulfonate monooxygenase SsuD/methylene tetrahydromethanopterin reductase-like flavin-dependent oxidoreductase (luciferase family)
LLIGLIGAPPRLRLATRADDLGLDRVDVAEGWTHDSMILLAELALRTSRIDLGTSVISAWGRTPATIALGAAGLQRCSEGRFSLGIGAGSPPLTEGFHAIRWHRPLVRLRETLTAVRALLSGDRLGERFDMAAGVNAVIEAAHGDRRPELPAVAEDLAREVMLMGTYDQAKESMAASFAAGADSVHLVLPPDRPEGELAEIVDVAARIASANAALPVAATSATAT